MWIWKLPCITKHIKLQSPIQVTTFCSLSITWCSQTCIERPQKTEKGSKHKRESYLCGPFSALTCSSMPQNLICISILSQLVCGSNTQRSLTWWALWVRKAGALDAELSNSVSSSMESVVGIPWWRSKPSVTAAGGSFPLTHHFFYTSEFKMSLKRNLITWCTFLQKFHRQKACTFSPPTLHNSDAWYLLSIKYTKSSCITLHVDESESLDRKLCHNFIPCLWTWKWTWFHPQHSSHHFSHETLRRSTCKCPQTMKE